MKVLIAIPACKKLDYGPWESGESPHYDQTKAYRGQGYGVDIHISGPNDRISAVENTWFRDVPVGVDARFFYGSDLGVPDDYAHLPHKTLQICRTALESGYDYLFKCDDDTYVWPNRLLGELETRKFDYGGYAPHENCTGGPGYWLSRRAMEVVSEFANPDEQWAEDVMVCQTLRKYHVMPFYLTGHRVGGAAHWYDLKCIDDATVTCHAVKPEGMFQLYRRDHPNA